VATEPTPSRPNPGGSTPAQQPGQSTGGAAGSTPGNKGPTSGNKPSTPTPTQKSSGQSGAGKTAAGRQPAASSRGATTTAPPTSPGKSGTGGSSPAREGGASSGQAASTPASAPAKPMSTPAQSVPASRTSAVRGEAAGVTVDPAERARAHDPRTGSGAAAATVAPPTPTVARAAGPRRARLLVTRLDPWSVMKTSFMLSVSVGIVLLVATALLWWTLDVTQVFSTIGRTVNDIAGSGTTSFDFLSLVGFSRVMGVALVLVAIEIVLWSALATLFAFLYNLSVGLTGGLEVTLSEDA